MLKNKFRPHQINWRYLCTNAFWSPPTARLYLKNLEGGATVDLSEIKRIEAQWTEQAQAVLNKIKAEGKAQGVTVKTSVAKSDLIAESIIAAAEKQKADLIVMASHGRKGIKRLLLGSETQHVLTHSQVPVLVLR